MQVRVEEDEVNVALQVLQAPQQQLLAVLLRLTTFDLRRKGARGVLQMCQEGLGWWLWYGFTSVKTRRAVVSCHVRE